MRLLTREEKYKYVDIDTNPVGVSSRFGHYAFDDDLTDADIRVLIAMYDLQAGDSEVAVPVEEIAWRTHKTERSVQRILSELLKYQPHYVAKHSVPGTNKRYWQLLK